MASSRFCFFFRSSFLEVWPGSSLVGVCWTLNRVQCQVAWWLSANVCCCQRQVSVGLRGEVTHWAGADSCAYGCRGRPTQDEHSRDVWTWKQVTVRRRCLFSTLNSCCGRLHKCFPLLTQVVELFCGIFAELGQPFLNFGSKGQRWLWSCDPV